MEAYEYVKSYQIIFLLEVILFIMYF